MVSQQNGSGEFEVFSSQLPSGIQIDVSTPPESTQQITQITVETGIKPEFWSHFSLELPAGLKPLAPACSQEAIAQLLEQLASIDITDPQRSDGLNPYVLQQLHLAEIIICGDCAISELQKTFSYSPNQHVHLIAVEALEKIGSPEALQALSQALSETPNSSVRADIARVLGERAIEKAVPSLVNALQAEEDVGARQRLIEALGKIGGEDATDALIQMHSEQGEKAGYAVISALGATSNERGVPILIAILRDTKATISIRQSAAKALSNFCSKEVIETLIDVLSLDCNATVRAETANALADSMVLLAEKDPCVSEQVEAEVIRALVAALDDPSLLVSHNAVRALMKLGSEAATLALEENHDKVIKILTLYQPNIFLLSAEGVTEGTKEHYQDPSFACKVFGWWC